MKAARSSKTAEQMALSRAIETRKPPHERICDDPFAERFLGAPYKLLLLARPLRDAVEKQIESMFAGHHYYVIARTRYFDDVLRDALADRPEQLVILGAGYDSRAQRFARELAGVAVFEVDHPATSAAKRARIAAMPAAQSARVTYVPVDFNVEKLADRLHASGYRDGRKNIFLWEGVTPYLAPQAVDGTLQFVRSTSAAGSTIVFDYVLRSFVDGRCAIAGARNELERMRATAEPLVFGIEADEIAAFLSARGFRDVLDTGAGELKANYFAAQDPRTVKAWWRIVRARVA